MPVDNQTFQKRIESHTFQSIAKDLEGYSSAIHWASGLDSTHMSSFTYEILPVDGEFHTFSKQWTDKFFNFTKKYLNSSILLLGSNALFHDDDHKLTCCIQVRSSIYKGNTINIEITAKDWVKDALLDYITTTLPLDNRLKIQRFFINNMAGGSIDTSESTVDDQRFVYQPEFYSNIPDPKVLWKGYSESRSNILIIKGPYGVGKSEYGKQIITLALTEKRDVYFIDDPRVCNNISFIDRLRSLEDGSVIVFEDADQLMTKRTDGNLQMSGILNLTSGIIAKKLKLVFLTNLENLKDVDGAFLRSGRLYDILDFKLLNNEQANQARAVLGLPSSDSREMVSLADITHEVDHPSTNKPIFGLTTP